MANVKVKLNRKLLQKQTLNGKTWSHNRANFSSEAGSKKDFSQADMNSFFDTAYGGPYLHNRTNQPSAAFEYFSKDSERNLRDLYEVLIKRLEPKKNKIIKKYRADEDAVLKQLAQIFDVTTGEEAFDELKKAFGISTNKAGFDKFWGELRSEIYGFLSKDKFSDVIISNEVDKVIHGEKLYKINSSDFQAKLLNLKKWVDENNEMLLKSLSSGSISPDVLNSTYALAYTKIIDFLSYAEEGYLTESALNNLRNFVINTQMGFLKESMLPSIFLEYVYENIAGATVQIQTGQSGKGQVMDIQDYDKMWVENAYVKVAENLIKSNYKKLEVTSENTAKLAKADLEAIITKGPTTARPRFDIKNYKSSYKNAISVERDIKVGYLLKLAKEDTPLGQYVFVNSIINNMFNTQNNMFVKMLYLYILFAYDGIEEIFESNSGQAANFMIMGNTIIRFSDFLTQLFNLNAGSFGNREEIELITNNFSMNDSNAKQLLQQKRNSTAGIASYSKQSFDALKNNSQFIDLHKAKINLLKKSVYFKAKLNVDFKNLNK